MLGFSDILSFLFFSLCDKMEGITSVWGDCMKYFWTFFWVILLVEMLSYVVCSMLGTAFDYKGAAVLGLITTVLILVVPAIIPDEPVEHH
jgi:Protein of unknown function (DUF2929)